MCYRFGMATTPVITFESFMQEVTGDVQSILSSKDSGTITIHISRERELNKEICRNGPRVKIGDVPAPAPPEAQRKIR